MGSSPASHTPSGVLAFLFTDIVGSTTLWESSSHMGAALGLHNQLIVATITDHGGYVFSNTGDGFAAAFDDPVAAVAAATAAQAALAQAEWPTGTEIKSRMGIHVGRAEERDNNYFGPTVNRAARLMSLAGPQQLLISADVQTFVSGSLPEGASSHGLGDLKLKDVPEPMKVFSVEADHVERAELPEVDAQSATGSLPIPLTELVGRDADLERIAASVGDHRLVSIVGPGGTGKTSLAVEVARASVSKFHDGAWFVPLADVGESSSVVNAIGRALNVTNTSTSIDQLIASALKHRQMLLVFDNCEHVLDAVVDAVGKILTASDSVHVLVTSQLPLHLAGEMVDLLGPLDLDAPTDGPSDAARLFIERSAAAGAVVRPSDLPHVEQLCARLDGLPLAIELAAARSRVLPPERLANMLDARFDLLISSSPTGDRRHQTLRALVESSYDLLEPTERQVFAQLGVFAGSFDLDDGVAVATTDGVSEIDVINAMVGLVDKSLVQHGRDDSAPYRLLETLGAYALERLRAADAEPIARDRHAQWFREVATDVRQNCFGPAERATAERVRTRRSDFENAVGWAAGKGDLDTALGIVVDLNCLATLRGWRHAPSWLEHLIESPPEPLPDLWAEFLAASASTALHAQGSTGRAHDLAQRAVELDPENPQAHVVLAQTARTAEDCLTHAGHVFAAGRERSEPLWEMAGRVYECFGLLVLGRFDNAHERAIDLQRMATELGDRSSVGWARYLIARALSPTDPARAMILLDEARSIAEETANPQLEINARRQRAAALLTSRDPEAAEASIRRGILRALELGEVDHALRTCGFAAMTFALRGEDETAARLIGRLGLPTRTPAERPLYHSIMNSLRSRLGDRFDLLSSTGRELTPDEVVELTLATIDSRH